MLRCYEWRLIVCDICDNIAFSVYRPDQESQKIFKAKNSMDGEQIKTKVTTQLVL